MPPAKSKQPSEAMKQKSLMGWFNKAPEGSATPAKPAKSRLAVATPGASSSAPSLTPPSPPQPQTPAPKKSGTAVSDSNYTRSSDGERSVADAPPSSDPIDVDMLSDEEDPRKAKSVGAFAYIRSGGVKRLVQARKKRKIVVEESDDEEASGTINVTAYRKRATARMQSPESEPEPLARRA